MDNARWHSMAWEQFKRSSWHDPGQSYCTVCSNIVYYIIWKICVHHPKLSHQLKIQVFLGHSGGLDTDGNELPRLVYVSREKRPGFQHHKKAGAMNALVLSLIYGHKIKNNILSLNVGWLP